MNDLIESIRNVLEVKRLSEVVRLDGTMKERIEFLTDTYLESLIPVPKVGTEELRKVFGSDKEEDSI